MHDYNINGIYHIWVHWVPAQLIGEAVIRENSASYHNLGSTYIYLIKVLIITAISSNINADKQSLTY
jgi:hypothetical protein